MLAIHGKRDGHATGVIQDLGIVGKNGLVGGVSVRIHVVNHLWNRAGLVADFSRFGISATSICCAEADVIVACR